MRLIASERNGCVGKSADATHTCRAYGWPPVRTYGCTVREINQADDESREAMRQLMWAAYDLLKGGLALWN